MARLSNVISDADVARVSIQAVRLLKPVLQSQGQLAKQGTPVETPANRLAVVQVVGEFPEADDFADAVFNEKTVEQFTAVGSEEDHCVVHAIRNRASGGWPLNAGPACFHGFGFSFVQFIERCRLVLVSFDGRGLMMRPESLFGTSELSARQQAANRPCCLF